MCFELIWILHSTTIFIPKIYLFKPKILICFRSGGLVLDMAVDQFNGYEVFQPIVNGIGGNLVSVQASRISTMFHKTAIKGFIPSHTKQWVSPITALISGGKFLFLYNFFFATNNLLVI